MRYVIFAAVIGLAVATPSFAQQNGGAATDKSGTAASSMPSSGTMEQNSSRSRTSTRHGRRVSAEHARTGASASRAKNEQEQKETAQLNQQQLQQATPAR